MNEIVAACLQGSYRRGARHCRQDGPWPASARGRRTHEDIFGRKQDLTGAPAGWFAGAGKDVVHGASHRRGDVALIEPPLRHGHRRARRIGRRALGGNLLNPAKRRTQLRERRSSP